MRHHPLSTALCAAFAIGVAAIALPAHGQAVKQPDALAASSTTAAAIAAKADEPVSLEDIRNFTRVYQIVRQAYVEKLDNKTIMKAAISGMLAGLDPHSQYLDKEGLDELNEDTTGQYGGLGIEVLQVDGLLKIVSPIDDTPASRAGIKPGDTILKIDGKLIDAQNIDESFKKLRGAPGSKITLTILHEKTDKPVDMPLVRERIAVTSVKVRELAPGFAYIRLSQFQEDTSSDLEKKLNALIAKNGPQKGAVLDLRSNPGGLLTAAVGVSDAFLDSGNIVTTKGRLTDANLRFDAHPGDLLRGAPMVILTDNGTASAAEIVAGALKDNRRALTMGRRTFGKGVVQTVLPLDAEHAVKITTARYYTPNGTSIQAEGIKPDIALADLAVNKADTPPQLIGSEADLPNHLVNEKAGADEQSANDDEGKLAIEDYALSQALNVLKGMALNRPAPATK
ncbi:S41A family C-terminal processing peptidase-3 [Luteibacter rhizovicinus]|uniref:S41A family C-terminal processing peptidase-3 n=1 Tax=Luteibacter rhizovicinus TaxID=242606 RepID=A0A4R3YSW7_9GAMM|nr:S41 family peptidase [Luteibacter rhizovicinus]TCV96095.1 S41A family C-terminal processing peptidase-3 [Luteibacter rhizovicinus]